MIVPEFMNLANEYQDQTVFSKVDVNFNPDTAGHSQITSLLTFQVLINGRIRHKMSGGDVNNS